MAIGHNALPAGAVALLLGAGGIMDSMRVAVNLVGNRPWSPQSGKASWTWLVAFGITLDLEWIAP
jgi:hypothetical protein